MENLCSSMVFFPCKSIDVTRNYYQNVLGFEIYKDLGKSIWVDGGRGYIGFVEYDPPRPPASGACISFNLCSKEAVDEMYRKLNTLPALGLQGEPKMHPDFPVYSFFLSDPNGYLLEFQKPTD